MTHPDQPSEPHENPFLRAAGVYSTEYAEDWPDEAVDAEAQLREAAHGDQALLERLRGQQIAEGHFYDRLEKVGKDHPEDPELRSAEALLQQMNEEVQERQAEMGILPPEQG